MSLFFKLATCLMAAHAPYAQSPVVFTPPDEPSQKPQQHKHQHEPQSETLVGVTRCH